MNRERIICFTHAGGYARFFNDLERDLPNIGFIKLEYPGHGKRGKEDLLTDISLIVDDMYKAFLNCYTGESYSMLGYSMGGIIVAELLKVIIADKVVKAPHDVFICSCNPHDRKDISSLSPVEFDAWIKDRIEYYNEVPDDKSIADLFWKMYMPLYRSD